MGITNTVCVHGLGLGLEISEKTALVGNVLHIVYVSLSRL